MLRPTMAQLIDRVRRLIGDPASASQRFADREIQDELDHYREDVRYEALRAVPSYTTSGVQWLDYYSSRGDWEASEVLIDGHFTTLTPAAADEIVGHWTFAAGTGSGQLPPVLLAGSTYDVHAAAANLLEFWAATLADAYDFSADGASFRRSQMGQSKLALAAQYRRKQRPKVVRMVRDDAPRVQEDRRRQAIGPVSDGVPFITGD